MKTKARSFHVPIDRRRFFRSMAAVSAGFTLPGYLAEALTLTPQMEQGPYYPLGSNIPLDKDNDLVQLNDNLTPASGMITHIQGRVLDSSGNSIRGALVELWHADSNGYYVYSDLHPRNPHVDPNFAGFGQFLTGSSGGFRFRTIKAGLYAGRARHFHFGITIPGQLSRWTTQIYWNEPQPNGPNGQIWPYYTCRCYVSDNLTNDPVLNEVSDVDQKASVIVDFTPVDDAPGEVQAHWDIVMGQTPMYPSYPGGGNFVIAGKPVVGPSNSVRFMLTVPVYTNYTYEVYGNPTLADLSWAALPFSLSQFGAVDTNKVTATANGTMTLFLQERAAKGFYQVAFRVPGANTGTP
jgi:protocatechuate 3,4-dioxygenase beta subunit